MWSCSTISQAAASGSTNTTCSFETFSGTSNKISVGSVMYSAKQPSFLQMPIVCLLGQCLTKPWLHHSQSGLWHVSQ